MKKSSLKEKNSKDVDSDLVRQFEQGLEDLKAGRYTRIR